MQWLAQEAEIKLKKYKSLKDDDQSVMQVSAVPHSEVLAVQGLNRSAWTVLKVQYPDTRCECTRIKLERKPYML